MAVKKGQELDLLVTQVAFGGKGIARVDGFTIFVDKAVTGDRVRARIIKKKKNYAESRILELIEPSPFRVEAPCPYSGVCGGCKWQFLDYQRQLKVKQQHVGEALEHIGLIHDVQVHDTISLANQFGYRNKMEFSCADRRWLMPEELGKDDVDTGMALGLHVPGTFFKVLDIEACLLQPELGNRILSDVRNYIKASHLPVYGLRSHQGFWRFLVLRHSVAHNQWMVNLITASQDRASVQPLADMLMEKYPEVASVMNNITSSKAGVAIGEYEIHLAGDSVIRERIGDHEFEISSGSFFQTNTLGAQRLYEVTAQYAQLTGSEVVVDLYCGAGSIAIYLSKMAAKVIGLEIVESAVQDAVRNCHLNNVDNCRFVAGDIRLTLPGLDVKPDVLIIDPPRAGMHKDVVKEVLALSPDRIVYVSCNPATMARDIAMLKDSYKVIEAQPVDMFPNTFHIEAVVRMEKI